MLDVAAVMIAVSAVGLWFVRVPPRWSDSDFSYYYVSSRMLLEGQNPYTTPLQAMSQALGFRFSEEFPIAGYPPSFLRLFAPLAALPPRVAFAIWVSMEIGCLAVVLWLTRRLLGERLSARGWLFVATLAICSRTVTYHLFYSQIQLLLAALVLAGYAAHRGGKHGWACLLVSIAGILKFYPFLLLPWFIWSSGGGVRARLYRVLGVVGFVLASVALTGPVLWRDFLQHGIPMAVGEEIGRNFHFSLPALVTNLGYAHHDFRPSPAAKQWWWFMGSTTSLVVIAGAYCLCVATPRNPETQFSLLCVAMLLGTVTVQGHYFVFLVFPLTVAAIRVAAKPTPVRVVGLVLLVVAMNCVDPPDSPFLWQHPVLYLLVGDIPLYGLLGLGAFFGRELWSRRTLTPNPADGQY
jgi:multidrug transporter EmrE-like cation transporter